MSITFSGNSSDPEDSFSYVNVSNDNAKDLLEWIGVSSPDFCGELPATDVAAKCRRRLWPEPRNFDDERLGVVHEGSDGSVRAVECRRRAGYLRDKTVALLALCERLGPATLYWY